MNVWSLTHLIMIAIILGFFPLVAVVIFLILRKTDRVKIVELKKPDSQS
jgi:hypothetical protein